MTVRLYSYWRSSAAYRVRIALNTKGIEYDTVSVSLAPGDSEHWDEPYISINPQGLVPFFDDGNVALGQSMAILEYIEETYPGKSLLPATAEGRGLVRAFCNSICCDIHPLNIPRVLNYLKGSLDVNDGQCAAWYAHWVHEGFRSAELFTQKHSARQRFTYGDSVSLADALLVPQVYNARRFNVPLNDFPTLTAIVDACNGLPAFQAAAPENQPDASK
jgi:maleylacetoacetate isomerase